MLVQVPGSESEQGGKDPALSPGRSPEGRTLPLGVSPPPLVQCLLHCRAAVELGQCLWGDYLPHDFSKLPLRTEATEILEGLGPHSESPGEETEARVRDPVWECAQLLACDRETDMKANP